MMDADVGISEDQEPTTDSTSVSWTSGSRQSTQATTGNYIHEDDIGFDIIFLLWILFAFFIMITLYGVIKAYLEKCWSIISTSKRGSGRDQDSINSNDVESRDIRLENNSVSATDIAIISRISARNPQSDLPPSYYEVTNKDNTNTSDTSRGDVTNDAFCTTSPPSYWEVNKYSERS